MMALAEEIRRRGGTPLDPLVYKRRYLDRLSRVIRDRLEELRSGGCSPDKYLVPGARALLESLKARGLRLYLASGTDEEFMKEEADLLDVTRYFDGGVFGALDDLTAFSKRMLVARIVQLPGVLGDQLIAFGDGYVEIEEVRQVGGITVGVATDEPECRLPDQWKRQRLIGVGADYIVPNYLDPQLLPLLFGESRYPVFDRSRLLVKPLAERAHDLHIEHWLSLEAATPDFAHPDLPAVAEHLATARASGAARILMMGAHVLRAGVNRHIIDLLERGFVGHIAMNGAGAIHDYELARIGATTESVDRYIRTGEFGLWKETGELNDWIREAAAQSHGLGETIGRRIAASDYPYRELSVFAAAYRAGVPVTVHAGIGYDIIHEHPNCDGAALGAASYRDFLIFARAVERLEGGVLLNFGSAIMGPEVYLKALAMARNVARQEGRSIRDFTTAVFDLVPIHGGHRRELPKTDPGYYFRPQKTILVRTVADGGRSYYFCGPHRATFPALWRLLTEPRS
jgi:phosphoglycolate phosphatase-like HAD superfamily hydrolase